MYLWCFRFATTTFFQNYHVPGSIGSFCSCTTEHPRLGAYFFQKDSDNFGSYFSLSEGGAQLSKGGNDMPCGCAEQ